VNPYGQNTLKAWFFDVGYLCLLVISLVVIGFCGQVAGADVLVRRERQPQPGGLRRRSPPASL